ncbi:hypothetical protein BpHYR1_014021 [Brachionus plicatilis]|uniref:Uncharacterized protein n=1 Tax=Brachionus plicatilis TaxID=10195 RepID=A0A3M7PQ49_BRAPC|nr:hypothetical protein BpHYR1_014021 [Brachionus plicatilis]
MIRHVPVHTRKVMLANLFDAYQIVLKLAKSHIGFFTLGSQRDKTIVPFCIRFTKNICKSNVTSKSMLVQLISHLSLSNLEKKEFG